MQAAIEVLRYLGIFVLFVVSRLALLLVALAAFAAVVFAGVCLARCIGGVFHHWKGNMPAGPPAGPEGDAHAPASRRVPNNR